MKFSVYSLPRFEKQAKKLIKKYPSLREELSKLVDSLKFNPHQGTPLSKNCFKIRISISSKGKGKSGGGRVITHFLLEKHSVYLLLIYDKSEIDSVTEKTLEEIINEIE